jgi:anaerobic selenocysteine-containing dehydrogenase
MAQGNGTEIKRASCYQCWWQCGVKVHVKDGKELVKIEGDPDNALGGRGRLCVKSTAAIDFHQGPNRLNHPMKRAGKRGEYKWERIAWDQALDEIAEKLAAIKSEYGPEALMVIGGTQHGVADWAAWRFANVFGTPNIFHQGKNCGEAEFLAMCLVYGYTTRSMGGGAKGGVTKCVVNWGANLAESGHLGFRAILRAQEKGAKLVVVDPRRTKTVDQADIWVQLRPGTDGALALGMINVIIEEGLYDKEFVARWCLGFDRLQDVARKWTPQRTAEVTRVPVETIIEVARLYATSKPAHLTWGVAACQLGRGVKGAVKSAVLGKCILRAITGNLGVTGGEPFMDHPYHLNWIDNLQWDLLLDHPERTRDNLSVAEHPVTSVKAYRMFREAMAKVYPKGFGAAHYMVFPASWAMWRGILEQQPYPIKAVCTQGSNTLVNVSDAPTTHKALKSENLDLHFAMDLTMQPTASLADYVLPAAGWLERPNLRTDWGLSNLYQCTEAAVEPLHERRDDYWLWAQLAKRLGMEREWPETLEGMFDVFLAGTGMSFGQHLEKNLDHQFTYGSATKDDRAYEKTGFATFSGKVELFPTILEQLGYDASCDYDEPPRSPYATPELAEDYPLILISGSRVREFWHSSYRDMERLRGIYPRPRLEIHPEDAAPLAIKDGDPVYIETPEGKVKQWAKVDDGIMRGVVHADGYWWYPEMPKSDPCLFGVWESNINAITPGDPATFDYAGDNNFRALLCRVYKAAEI